MEKYEEKIEILDQHDFYYEENITKYQKKFAKQIGQFIMEFSVIEYDLNLAISEILNSSSHEIGLSVIRTLSLKNKVELFYKLYLPLISIENLKHPDGLAKDVLKKINNSLLDLINFRNRIAHANWSTLDKDGYVRSKISTNEDGFIQFVRFKVSSDLFEQRLKQIKMLDMDINEFYQIALHL